MIVQIILVCVIIILILAFLKGRWNERYWKKRGIKFHPRNRLFGPFWDFMVQDRPMFEVFGDVHKKYKDEPVVGIGSVLAPMLYVIDPQIIQHVFQTDFQSFHHRGIEAQPGDLLADNLLFMNGNRWKLLRQSISPLFTASKLKSMYYIMDKSAQDFVKFLENNPEKLNGDTYNTMTTFCSAAVSASVFGLTTKSVFDSPFLKMARKAFESNFKSDFRFITLLLNPWLFRKLGMSMFGEHEDLFISAIKQTIRQREIDNIKKHDFADICVTLQKSQLRDPETGFVLDPTDELLAAQGFFFFIAGVEPSATALYCTLLELGLNPHILERLHHDVDTAFEKYNGQITYEAVFNMKYMDMVLNESMRKHPPVVMLIRECVQDSVLPVVNLKVEKGTKIIISPYHIHNDPDRYPNPESFIPERFETKDASELYLPFGKGNRTCIGERFARLQVKTGLSYLLRHYTVKTILDGDKLKFHKKQFQLWPANANIKLIRRENVTKTKLL
ncbi:cytochrome P450 6k1-like [Epargyreus clarus]|uniref:cytochrome P450 6k1-like n=1 Tax=Epargyreus clarus TaxID=520877 RepID=UPI003C2E0952